MSQFITMLFDKPYLCHWIIQNYYDTLKSHHRYET